MPKKSNKRDKYGRIRVRVYIGTDTQGKRIYKHAYGKTQKEADLKADAIRKKYRHSRTAYSPDDPFDVFADAYLDIKETNKDTSYMIGLRGRIAFWKDHLGSVPISDIHLCMLQDPLNELAKCNPRTQKPTGRKTIGDYIGTVKQIFRLAAKNRTIEYNPAEYLEMPSTASPKSQRRALDDEEQQWIIDTPHGMQLAAMIMMYGGLRRGELIPLQVKDVDFAKKQIQVTKAVEMVHGQPQIKQYTKTDSGVRIAGIPDILVDFLKTRLAGKSPLELVFPNRKGGMVTEGAWRRMWDSYLVELNFKYGNKVDRNGKIAKSKYNPNGIDMAIPRITAHWLRHTYATILYLSGVDKLEAAAMMGHKDVKMILEIYSHLDRLYGKRSLDKINTYLKDNGKCVSYVAQNA